ncbi:MAG: hypothetical protein LBC57_00805 [Treponema sp.]|nr:hypothetical protein [Treponema sp.]
MALLGKGKARLGEGGSIPQGVLSGRDGIQRYHSGNRTRRVYLVRLNVILLSGFGL